MPVFKLTLAYDGTEFAGWQSQRSGRTVQDVLASALATLAAGEPVKLAAAGRTDAGVHAVGQVASCILLRAYAPADLRRALNALLPPDLRVVAAEEAPDAFHARRSALSKLYRYELDLDEVQTPQRRRFAAHLHARLDPERLGEAAALFLGRQDFASLASAGGGQRTTVRTVTRSEAALRGSTFVYEVEADGFLRKMVRSMVGGILAAGRGRVSVDDLRRALALGDRRAWPAPAPARGLTLVRVDYPAPEAPVLP
jgi:tRNA pseudouridine38-40 synthase